MVRSSISARLAGLGAATLLIAGLFAQATPILAASPGHVSPAHQAVPDHRVRVGRSGTLNLRALSAEPKKKLPFNASAVSATLAKVDAKIGAGTKGRGGNKPNVVGPPAPDPVTTSGAPAAATPVAVAGHAGATPPAAVAAPDPSIAVGPDETLEIDSSGIEVRDRAGNSLNVGGVPVALPTFFRLPEGAVTTFAADPEVLFDSVHQRWVATELSWDCHAIATGNFPATYGHGFIDFAISDTSDPLGSWTSSSFEWPDSLPDRPTVGTSTDKFALTTSLVAMGPGGSDTTPGCASGALLGSEFVVVDWASLGPVFAAPSHYAAAAFSGLDSLRVAVSQPAVDADLRMIGLANGGFAGDVWYVDVTGSAVHSTIAESAIDDLTADTIIPGFGTPSAPAQSGGGGILTSAINGGPESVTYANGQLAFTSTLPCTPTGDSVMRDCVRVTTLANPTPTAEPTRIGDVLLGTNGFDNTFGGLNWSANGNLFAVYTQSSGSTFASSVARYHLGTTVDQTAWSAPQTLSTGAGTYVGTAWGPYLGVATDPQVPGAVWVGDPAAAADGSWATTVHQLSVGDVGAGYFPISPVRVLDSRSPIGSPVGFSGPLTANVPKTFVVGGAHGIPGDAVAITGNLTVTGQTKPGSISLTPQPTANPLASTLNFPTGDNRGNNVTAALAPDGSLAIVYKAASGHTNAILDVTGYFRTTGSGARYNPISPLRILDTRAATQQGGTTFSANLAKTFMVVNGTTIPAGTTAITGNLAVIRPTAAGSVTLSPTLPSPLASTINFPAGDVRANGLTIPVNPVNGTVAAIYRASGGTVDLVLDVTGYYSADPGGLLFHLLEPGRRVDTRQPAGANGFGNGLSGAQAMTPRSVVIAGHDGLPGTAKAITGNLTVTGQTGAGNVTVTDVSIAHPLTSTINFPLGDTRGNGITAPLGSGTGEVWFVYGGKSGTHTQLILDITGYFE